MFVCENTGHLLIKNTILSGVTLNFVNCTSVFVSSVNIHNNGQFMIQGHFQMHFHPPVWHELKKKKKKKSTNPSGKDVFLSYDRTCTTMSL